MFGEKLFVGGKKMFVGAVILVTFVTSPVSWAGLVHEFTPDEEYLAFGAEFDSVVGLFGNRSDGTQQWLGSANVVSQHEVLSSAHQIGNFESYTIKSGNNLVSGVLSEYTSSSEVIVHPGWRGTSSHDQAIIRFDQPINTIPSTKIYLGDNSVGKEYAIAGYGGTGLPGSSFEDLIFDRNKRAGINVMHDFRQSDILGDRLDFRFVAPGHDDFNDLGLLATPGYSGGSALIKIDDEWQIAGVLARATPVFDYNSTTTASRVDSSWFNSNVTTVPEPGSFTILALSTCLMLLFYHKKNRMRKIA